jgi:hypothetical protein
MHTHTHAHTQTVVFIPEDEKELRLAMRNWTIAYTRALEGHLQVGVGCMGRRGWL